VRNAKAKRPIETTTGTLFKLSVITPVLVLGVLLVQKNVNAFIHPSSGSLIDLAFWTLAVAISELLPVPVSQVLRLSLSFPILLAVGLLHPPVVAGTVALVGEFDPREIRREISVITTLFNRCQLAAAFYVGSLGFHALAAINSQPLLLLPAVFVATATTYLANVTFVLSYMRVVYRKPLREVLVQLRVGALAEFLLSYVGLGFVGVVMASLNRAVGLWSVAAFILPLLFARQMFFRSMALEEASKEIKDRERVLRALSNRMAEERQDERMQIAGYLHDDLAQQLFRLTLQAEMAKKRLAQGDVTGVGKDLDGIIDTKQQTSDMVRALIRDLHRSPIGRRGLAEAIESFAEDMSRGGPTSITADVVEVSLPPPIQLLIYQIAREAAMNALKHAHADHIWIALHETEDGVELQIRDDGTGFDITAAPPEGHFGSVMMRERAQVTGGTFHVKSEIGWGTTITASFPRVWVEEGTLLEAGAVSADRSEPSPKANLQPPTGSTTASPPAGVSQRVVGRRPPTGKGSRHRWPQEDLVEAAQGEGEMGPPNDSAEGGDEEQAAQDPTSHSRWKKRGQRPRPAISV